MGDGGDGGGGGGDGDGGGGGGGDDGKVMTVVVSSMVMRSYLPSQRMDVVLEMSISVRELITFHVCSLSMAASKEKHPALAGQEQGQSNIKRASALRVKYRIFTKQAFHASLVAQHCQNRGGIAINGNRCDEILRQVLGHFDEEEANHGAVAIEETPGCSAIRDYNREKAIGDSALAEVSEAAIPYGSVGSSHINQVIRNIIFKAHSDLVPEALDSDGCLSLERISLIDPALAGVCDKGLKWDILSHRIEIEEPDGIACIVAALNERASAQMTMHEMEVIKTLQRVCSVETALSQTVALETVRARLHQHGFSALAESPGMPHLFRFVLEQGDQSTTNIMEPLFAYHEKFVNPKLRRLREHHFKDVCLVDNAWLRLILLQCAYAVDRKQIRDTWIECFGPGAIAAIMKLKMKPIREETAIIVKTFHKEYAAKAAYSHFPPGYKIKFLGRFGSKLGEALLAGGEVAQVVDGVRAVTWKFEEELRKDMPNTQEMMLGPYLGKPSEVPEQKGASSTLAEQNSGISTLISFDADGNRREPALADASTEVMVIPWTCMEEHMESLNETVSARLFETLHVCSEAVSAVDSLGKVQLEGNPDKSDMCRVYCKEPALAGSLIFFPLIPNAQCISTTESRSESTTRASLYTCRPLCDWREALRWR